MALKVTFSNPAFPKGTEFDTVFGLVKNGSPKTLTEEDERMCLARTGNSVKDQLAGNDAFKVEGTPILSSKEVNDAKGVEVSDTAPMRTLAEREEEYALRAENEGELPPAPEEGGET
jgi:hypothetical protein